MLFAFDRYVAETLVPSLTQHDKPEVILLTCMDYRYAHRIVDVMDQRGMRLKYDMFVLAGAALGGNPGLGPRTRFRPPGGRPLSPTSTPPGRSTTPPSGWWSSSTASAGRTSTSMVSIGLGFTNSVAVAALHRIGYVANT